VLVFKPVGNNAFMSFDGVPAGAARIADEVRAVVAANPSLVYISLVGNSLGGIYARYAAALMFVAAADGADGRGLHSSTFQLNLGRV
jgi:predicted esterase YcpF (UPF0227 family)